jgi:hypothetical protein
MAAATDRESAIAQLVGETRQAREALHALVIRLRQERMLWQHELSQLTARSRLTRAQRDALSARFTRRRAAS